jgi:hypothetical protein
MFDRATTRKLTMNVVKDSYLWLIDRIEGHPHVALWLSVAAVAATWRWL